MTEKENLIAKIVDKIESIKMSKKTSAARREDGQGGSFVLSYLYYNGGQALPTTLGKMMDVSSPRITAILNELEERGLISRSISKIDRRNIDINLSPRGIELIEKKRQKQRERTTLLVNHLTVEDAQAFLRILGVIETTLAKDEDFFVL